MIERREEKRREITIPAEQFEEFSEKLLSAVIWLQDIILANSYSHFLGGDEVRNFNIFAHAADSYRELMHNSETPPESLTLADEDISAILKVEGTIGFFCTKPFKMAHGEESFNKMLAAKEYLTQLIPAEMRGQSAER